MSSARIPVLRVSLDPTTSPLRPQITWVLRTLLSGIGYAWHEVPRREPSDLSYSVNAPEGASAVWIKADLGAWDRLAERSLPTAIPSPEHRANDGRDRGGGIAYERDLIVDVFATMTGAGEQTWRANRHGAVWLPDPDRQRDALRRAPASEIGMRLGSDLISVGLPQPVARWPEPYRAAFVASHDVEYPEIIRIIEPLRTIRRQGTAGFRAAAVIAAGRASHWTFERWIDHEARSLGARPAFFFCARKGSLIEYALGTPDPFYDVRRPRFRRLFEQLRALGVEIGMHASYNAWKSTDTLRAEKERLEEASGGPIFGNRHHYWHLGPDPDRTLQAHEAVGFRYDSSIGHERYLGWRRGSTWPFFPFLGSGRRTASVLQVPTAWMDDHLNGHRADNPGDADELLDDLLATAERQGGCLMTDFHEYVFDDTLYPGWRGAFDRLVSKARRSGSFWSAQPGQVAEHWRSRYESIARASRGLEA